MSMPMTCPPHTKKARHHPPLSVEPPPPSPSPSVHTPPCGVKGGPHNDWLQYVLYYQDTAMLAQIITSAAENIRTTHDDENVTAALVPYAPSSMDSVLTLQIKLLVLLDQDEATRHQLCRYTSDLVRGRRPLCPKKASRFYADLHDILIPAWVRDETKSSAAFIDDVREVYLVS